MCELWLNLQMLYLTMVNCVSYFAVSLFLFTFHISMRAFYSDILHKIFTQTLLLVNVIPFFINFMDYVYIMFIFSFIYCSLTLTHNHKKFKKFIYLSSTILGIFSIIIIVVLITDLKQGFANEAKICNNQLI